jgi:hypothetical protein
MIELSSDEFIWTGTVGFMPWHKFFPTISKAGRVDHIAITSTKTGIRLVFTSKPMVENYNGKASYVWRIDEFPNFVVHMS